MKNKHFAIVVLAMAALLFIPLAANADEFWFFFGPQSPFPNAPTNPAVDVSPPNPIPLPVTNGDGFVVTLTPYSTAPTNIGASNGTLGVLTGRNLGAHSDEQGAGVHALGVAITGDSHTYEVDGSEAIRIDFPSVPTISGFASEHIFLNSLAPAGTEFAEQEIAHVWLDTVGPNGTDLGQIFHVPNVEFEDFVITNPAFFGRPVFVTADQHDILLYGVEVDTAAVPEPATMLLLGSGLIGLAGYARKKLKS